MVCISLRWLWQPTGCPSSSAKYVVVWSFAGLFFKKTDLYFAKRIVGAGIHPKYRNKFSYVRISEPSEKKKSLPKVFGDKFNGTTVEEILAQVGEGTLGQGTSWNVTVGCWDFLREAFRGSRSRSLGCTVTSSHYHFQKVVGFPKFLATCPKTDIQIPHLAEKGAECRGQNKRPSISCLLEWLFKTAWFF